MIVYILGGFGTIAGLDICKKLVKLNCKLNNITSDSDYIKFFLDSYPSDNDHMTHDQCYKSLVDGIHRAHEYSKMFNNSKILLGIGCNTMHSCLKTYKTNYTIPKNIIIVNMIETVSYSISILKDKKKYIYLLSTKYSYDSKIYNDELKKYKIQISQNTINQNNLIEKIILLIKCNKECKNLCKSLLLSYPDNCILILGCTELPIIFIKLAEYLKSRNIQIIDCNFELAKKIINNYKFDN
tara:strand:- start:1489 stop:2208 length:720 start_codon:yes stop_codon:yes gene_type:complete